MLIAQEYRRGVAFVVMDLPKGKGKGFERKAVGTAFFLFWGIAPGHAIVYAVTAWHVIQAGEVLGAKGLHLRVAHQGGYYDIPMESAAWEHHPTTDVAVARVEAPPDVWLYPRPAQELATEAKLAEHAPSVGEGDEVFFTGLFSRFPGGDQVLPIVRFGNIALMPYEPIQTQISVAKGAPLVPINAYLVEVRSWGGHSGSPTWVYFPMTREPTKSRTWDGLKPSDPMLLGLVQAHYPIDPNEDFFGDVLDGTRSLAANAGIAIVVPAQDIADVLVSEPVREERDALRAEFAAAQSGPLLDFAPPAGSEDEFENFEDLTRKLVNTPKPKDQ